MHVQKKNFFDWLPHRMMFFIFFFFVFLAAPITDLTRTWIRSPSCIYLWWFYRFVNCTSDRDRYLIIMHHFQFEFESFDHLILLLPVFFLFFVFISLSLSISFLLFVHFAIRNGVFDVCSFCFHFFLALYLFVCIFFLFICKIPILPVVYSFNTKYFFYSSSSFSTVFFCLFS